MPPFAQMEFTKDHGELKDWIPLIMDGRKQSEKIAATRIKRGTDIDFGNLTRSYINQIEGQNLLRLTTLLMLKIFNKIVKEIGIYL